MTNVGLRPPSVVKVRVGGGLWKPAATQHPVVAAALAGNRAVRSTPGRVMLAQTKDAGRESSTRRFRNPGAVARTPQVAAATGQSERTAWRVDNSSVCETAIPTKFTPEDLDEAL